MLVSFAWTIFWYEHAINNLGKLLIWYLNFLLVLVEYACVIFLSKHVIDSLAQPKNYIKKLYFS